MKDTIRRRIVKKELLFLLVIAMLCGASSCKKENTEPNSSNPNVLPPLTHEGKNTFGCKVNGEVWVAYAPFTVGGTIALEGNYVVETGSFLLEGNLKNNDSNRSERVRIGCSNLYSTGSCNIPITHDEVRGFVDYKGNFNCANYYYREELMGYVNITYLNNSLRIISGTFEMDLVNPSCPGDTIRIREGRFDWCY